MLGSDPERIAGHDLTEGVVRRVSDFASPYRGMIAGFLLTIVVQTGLDLVPPLLFKQIIDTAIPESDRALLSLLAALAVTAAFGEALLALLQRWWSARIGEGVIFDLRVALYDHVQRMPIGFFTRTQTGALISRMNNDVIGAQRALTQTLGQVVSNAITVVAVVITMLVLQWQLTLLALALLPLFVLPAKRVGRRLQGITREQMDLNASMNNVMTERFNVAGAMLVKLFGRYDDEVEEFRSRAGRVRDIGVTGAMYGRTFFVALSLVAAVGTAAVYWVGGQLVISDTITVGTLVALAAYVARIYTPLTSLTNARVDLMTTLVSFDRVFEVLDTPDPIPDRSDAERLEHPRGEIAFDDVWFAYPSPDKAYVASLEEPGGPARAESASVPVLRGVSATIEQGSLVALVGPSGAGKTTLTSLVPRLHDVTAGAVLVDGIDVRYLTSDSLRAAMGVVSQDPHLFHDTIRNNLRYARPSATEAEIAGACRAARIAEVIESMPYGYDTVVGERGYRLSGGEKQRLAIARMLLKDPSIVILDEATSHLDSESEALVQQALTTALAGRTAVVIAHRLSTITAADCILVLDAGRLVERGTHAELLALDGLYADLYRILLREEAGPA